MERQVSHEVIAVAIEEMRAGATRPSFAYLEGILRNWHNQGQGLCRLSRAPTLAKVLQHKPAEGSINRRGTALEARCSQMSSMIETTDAVLADLNAERQVLGSSLNTPAR